MSALACALVLAMGAACASGPKSRGGSGESSPPQQPPTVVPSSQPAEKTPAPYGPPSPYGPQPVAGSEPSPVPSASPSPSPQSTYGPQQVEYRPIILVLGPGLAKGYSYAGVLRALEDDKIPIAGIVGTEMGALVGALYSMSRSINDLEFTLLRFKEDVFSEKGVSLSSLLGGPSDGSKLESALDAAVGERELKEGRFPVRILVKRQGATVPLVIDSGRAADAIRAAMGVPGVFTTVKWEGQSVSSAGDLVPFGVGEARKLGSGPVVVIDALSGGKPDPAAKGERKKLSAYLVSALREAPTDLKDADLVIRINLANMDYLDFQKRTEAVFKGKKSAQQHLKEVRHWVGMPENEVETQQ